MEKEINYLRVVPFVRYVRKFNGRGEKTHEIPVDNLSGEEIRNMSCEPKILEKNADGLYYVDETPLRFRSTGLRGRLCYLYSELNREEQIKYLDRSIMIPTVNKLATRKQENLEQEALKKIKKRK